MALCLLSTWYFCLNNRRQKSVRTHWHRPALVTGGWGAGSAGRVRTGHAWHKLLNGAARWGFDSRAPPIVVLLEQALHLDTVTLTMQCKWNSDLYLWAGFFFSSPIYLKVFKGLSPEQRIGRLQLEDSKHDEKHVDAEGPSATAAGLNGNRYAFVSPL